jgi:hypothetical protein
MTQRSPACQECDLYVQAATTLKRVTLKGATFNTFDPTGKAAERFTAERETAAPPGHAFVDEINQALVVNFG